MARIINFKIEEDNRTLHKISEVVCIKCYSRWIAARPTITLLKNLECKNCSCGYVIETGEIMDEEN
jgi:hypothetical protein